MPVLFICYFDDDLHIPFQDSQISCFLSYYWLLEGMYEGLSFEMQNATIIVLYTVKYEFLCSFLEENLFM